MSQSKVLTAAQKRLLQFLKDCESRSSKCSLQELAKATGWTESTARTYLGKGYLSDFLVRDGNGQYTVRGLKSISETEFHQRITQTQVGRELGYFCKYAISKALLRKSRDNMLLALELYNRPSLDNRLDGFVVLFCMAWEQLLKAAIAESKGEEAIFRSNKRGRYRETIGLQKCLEELYEANDPVRKNLEKVKYLRDEATHLLMPELNGLLSLVFQSGVLNYEQAFRSIAKSAFLSQSSVGLFTLIVRQERPDSSVLLGRYGEQTADEILDLFATVEDAIESIDDNRFAISITYKLAFTKTEDAADIVLVNASDAAKSAIVIDKPVDPAKSHPHFTNPAIEEVVRQLKAKLSPVDMSLYERLDSKGRTILFNSYDFQCILVKEKWKNSTNQYHCTVQGSSNVFHRYSDAAIDFIVNRIVGNPEYLKDIRRSRSRPTNN